MPSATLPYWPAGLNEASAAAYVGLSVSSFREACAVNPVWLTERRKVWLREQLDDWLRQKAGLIAVEATPGAWKDAFHD